MRDCLKMTPVWLCAALALVLLTGCSQERSAEPQGGLAAADQQATPGSTPDLSEDQKSAYLRGVSAPISERGRPSVSGKEAMVHMTDAMRFVPPEVTITAGQSVVWMNTSKLVHTVTADPTLAKNPNDVQLPPEAQAFNSGSVAPGGTFRHVFEVPGTYRYFCIPHEAMGMVGTVIVKGKP